MPAGSSGLTENEHGQLPVETVDCRIERLGWGGLGIARHADGRIMLLRHSTALFPAELVRAEITWKARHAEGRVLDVLEPVAERVVPACPWAIECGGCDLQGAAGFGSSLKQQMATDLIAKQLGRDLEWNWTAADDYTKRNVIQLHYADGRLGYHQRGSHELVEVRHCMAARPALSDAINALRNSIADGSMPALPGRWELACGNPEQPVIAWHEGDSTRFWQLGEGGWQDSDGRLSFLLVDGEIANLASAFFQTSGGAAIRWFRALFTRWQLGGDRLHDLYGGCGLFSMILCDSFRSFSVVDNSAESITNAVANLKGQDARCFHRDVSSYVDRMKSRPDDVIILDPPRSGLGRALCLALNEQGAGTLVLIGCDGAEFCRDLKLLSQNWRLEKLEAADLFPWTVHCEFAALLSNRAI